MDRITVHEYIVPRGPVTHRECTVPRDLLEYILGVELEQEQTEYWMDIEQYSLLIGLPETKPNLKLLQGGK
tara:strand:- start:888 stop:1100 length:213 start_codon:yes stop_codon:yes gene_type:complete